MNVILEWLPFRCWNCEVFDENGGEVRVPQRKGHAGDRRAGDGSLGDPAYTKVVPSVGAEDQPQSMLQDDKEEERKRLRELMREFVSRGMKGVQVELMDEATGALIPATYIIDERLQNVMFSSGSGGALGSDAVSAGSPTGAQVPPEELARTAAADERSVAFAEVKEVIRASEADSRIPPEVFMSLSAEQRARFIMVIYTTEDKKQQQFCFLEASSNDRQRFVTCMRILRRYMDDHNGKDTIRQVHC